MKRSQDWNTQEVVDNGADKYIENHKCEVFDVTPYELSKEMGTHCNGAFCKKVYDWQKRRHAEASGFSVAVPANVDAEFRALLNSQVDDQCKQFTKFVGQRAAENERVSLQRVAEERRLRLHAEEAIETVHDVCADAEQRLEAANALITRLQEDLAKSRQQEQYWRGRCDQREAMMTHSDNGAEITEKRKEPVDELKSIEVSLLEPSVEPAIRELGAEKPDERQDSLF